MAIANLTITNEELAGKKISDVVGDTLVGTPAENKALFDAYSEVIKEKFNDLITTLGNFLSSSGVGVGDLSDTIKLILENGAEYSVPKLDANNKIASKYIDDASSSAKGLMSAEDKAKMDTLKPAVNYVASGTNNPPTSGAVYNAIQTIAGIGSNIDDYVIEEGFEHTGADGADETPQASVYWRWRKWNNGVAECFGTALYSVEGWEQWGNTYYGVYYDNGTPKNYAFNYPSGLFSSGLGYWTGSKPTIIASGGNAGLANSDIMCVGFSGAPSGAGTLTHTPKMYVMRPQSGAIGEYEIYIHAIGRWD